jgi:hypothetical protein
MRKVVLLSWLGLLAGCAAQQGRPDRASTDQRLDQARAELTPPLATIYTLDCRRLVDQPGGENNSVARGAYPSSWRDDQA